MGTTSDPKGSAGLKKPPLAIVPSGALIPISKVLQLGAKKYGLFNWRDAKVDGSTYLHAAMRHLMQYIDGEDTDEESGESHVAHAAAGLCIFLDAMACETLRDDRPANGAAGKLIKERMDADRTTDGRSGRSSEPSQNTEGGGKGIGDTANNIGKSIEDIERERYFQGFAVPPRLDD